MVAVIPFSGKAPESFLYATRPLSFTGIRLGGALELISQGSQCRIAQFIEQRFLQPRVILHEL